MTKAEIEKRIEEIEDYLFELKIGCWTPKVSALYGKNADEEARLLKELEKFKE